VLEEGGLAGDALPGVVELDPGVGEAAAAEVGFALVHALFAIHAGDHGAVAEEVDGLGFVDDLFGLKAFGLDVGEELLLGADRAVVIDVDELRGEELVEGGHVLGLLGVIPGGFESQDATFVASER
jgi:hypothetical protein